MKKAFSLLTVLISVVLVFNLVSNTMIIMSATEAFSMNEEPFGVIQINSTCWSNYGEESEDR